MNERQVKTVFRQSTMAALRKKLLEFFLVHVRVGHARTVSQVDKKGMFQGLEYDRRFFSLKLRDGGNIKVGISKQKGFQDSHHTCCVGVQRTCKNSSANLQILLQRYKQA